MELFFARFEIESGTMKQYLKKHKVKVLWASKLIFLFFFVDE
jgi:hypothetical protein